MAKHMAGMLTKVVKDILAVNNLGIPAEDTRSKGYFNSQLVLWSSFKAYTDQFLSSFED